MSLHEMNIACVIPAYDGTQDRVSVWESSVRHANDAGIQTVLNAHN